MCLLRMIYCEIHLIKIKYKWMRVLKILLKLRVKVMDIFTYWCWHVFEVSRVHGRVGEARTVTGDASIEQGLDSGSKGARGGSSRGFGGAASRRGWHSEERLKDRLHQVRASGWALRCIGLALVESAPTVPSSGSHGYPHGFLLVRQVQRGGLPFGT